MTEQRPFISVIVPNWNGHNYTLPCLDSLTRLHYPLARVEVIVADNGSTDESVPLLRAKLAELEKVGLQRTHLEVIGENLGPTGAYNRCIANLSKESAFVLRLDNDTLVEPEAINELLKAFDNDPKVGIAGARQAGYDDPAVLIHGGGYLNPWWLSNGHQDAQLIVECDWVNGAAMFLRTELFSQKNLRFDEDYFLYWEDIDISLAARKAGYKLVYCPAAVVRHKGSASSDARSVKRRAWYYNIRGKLLLASRRGTLRQKISYLVPYLTLGCHRYALRSLWQGRLDLVTVSYQACAHFLLGKLGRQI